MKIVVLDGYLLGFGGRSWEPIARHGEFAYHDMTTAQDDVAAVIGNADAVYTNRCPVSAETIGRCPNLKMICSFGTGYNQIDLDAANRRGIVVCNIPSYGRGAVAQMAAALLFAIVRNVSAFDHYVKTVGWTSPDDPEICSIRQMELTGKTIGILGMGDIGYAVAIALRYIPDVQDDFHKIKNAQEARGIEMSGKAKLMSRIKSTASIIFPLIFTSIGRIDTISNAMELRGYGKHRKRTWYMGRKLQRNDYLCIALVLGFAVVALVITYHDGSRFYNPFV